MIWRKNRMKVGVIGAGVMGSGIAQAFAMTVMKYIFVISSRSLLMAVKQKLKRILTSLWVRKRLQPRRVLKF